MVRARTTLAAALATSVALVAPAASKASATTIQRAANCWYTPGNAYPWNITCIDGPYGYMASCVGAQGRKVNAGHLVRSCTWRNWNGKRGYHYFYSYYRI